MSSAWYFYQILTKLEIDRQISIKKSKCKISPQICPVGSEFMHMDRQSDMKIKDASSEFVNAPN